MDHSPNGSSTPDGISEINPSTSTSNPTYLTFDEIQSDVMMDDFNEEPPVATQYRCLIKDTQQLFAEANQLDPNDPIFLDSAEQLLDQLENAITDLREVKIGVTAELGRQGYEIRKEAQSNRFQLRKKMNEIRERLVIENDPQYQAEQLHKEKIDSFRQQFNSLQREATELKEHIDNYNNKFIELSHHLNIDLDMPTHEFLRNHCGNIPIESLEIGCNSVPNINLGRSPLNTQKRKSQTEYFTTKRARDESGNFLEMSSTQSLESLAPSMAQQTLQTDAINMMPSVNTEQNIQKARQIIENVENENSCSQFLIDINDPQAIVSTISQHLNPAALANLAKQFLNKAEVSQPSNSFDTNLVNDRILATNSSDQEAANIPSYKSQDLEVSRSQLTRHFTDQIPKCWEIDPSSGDNLHISVKLPKYVIPPWDGKRIHYPDFIQAFNAYIHLNKNLLIPQKIQELERALPIYIRSMIQHHARNEHGYNARLQYLDERYGDLSRLRSEFWLEITKFPVANLHSSNVMDTTDKLKALISSYRKYAISIDEEQLYNICIQKFNKQCYIPFINHQHHHVEELFRATLQWAKVQELGVRNEQPLQPLGKKWQKTITAKAVPVFTINKSQKPSTQARIPDKSDIQHHKKQLGKDKPPLKIVSGQYPSGFYKMGPQPRHPCCFCNGDHYAHLCLVYNSLQERTNQLKAVKRCAMCLNQHQGPGCKKSHLEICKWFNCQQKGDHNTVFCPKQRYPLSTTQVQKWKKKSYALFKESKGNLNFCSKNTYLQAKLTNEESFLQNPKTKMNNVQHTDIGVGTWCSIATPIQSSNKNTARSKLRIFTIHKVINSCMLLFETNMRAVTNNQVIRISGFLDSGSPRTFILDETSQQLQLKHLSTETLQLEGVENQITRPFKSYKVKFMLILPDDTEVPIVASTIHTIAWDLPRVNEEQFYKTYPHHADKQFCKLPHNHKIQLLIGNDFMWSFVEQTIHLDHPTTLIKTKFGWMLSGTKFAKQEDQNFIPLFFNTPNCVENIWKLEALGIESHNAEAITEEITALEQFFQKIEVKNKRYQIRWLYKYDPPNLADNFNVAYKRLQNQMHKLHASLDFQKMYTKYFDTLLDLNMIEECSLSQSNSLKHYLPHKGILDLTKSTPLRVVFDASSHARGKLSLNECMYKGTNFMTDILHILFNFQKEDIAVIADIKKAFHQISLHPDDRDVTRFLWLKNPKETLNHKNLIVYRFTCVPFGIITSPFILAATLLYHFQRTDKMFYEKFAKHFYVDNLVTSVASMDQAKDLYHRANKIFKEVSMELAQWGSNNPQLRSQFDSSISIDKDTTKVLGLIWDMKKDILYLNPKTPKTEVFTKRTFLAYTSSVYDPLGWFAPALVNSRTFLKQLWQLKLKWDEPLNVELQEVAKQLVTDLEQVFYYTFPRQLFPNQFNPNHIQIHTFVDASQVAYSVAIYLRLESPDSNKVMVRLRFGKSRVTPLKGVTIPKLELMAVLIGIRATDNVRKALNLENCKTILWSDSKCCLTWILDRKILTPFVQNRVKEINAMPNILFRYVPSAENPADIGSRGATADEITESIWWSGPVWLYQPENNWPITDLHIPEESLKNHSLQKDNLGTSLRLKLFACPKIRSLMPVQRSLFWDSNLTAREMRIRKSKLRGIPQFMAIPNSQDYELHIPFPDDSDSKSNSSVQATSQRSTLNGNTQHQSALSNPDYSSFSNFHNNMPIGISIEKYNTLRALLNTFHGCLRALRCFYHNYAKKQGDISINNKCWMTLPLTFAHAFLSFVWSDQRLHFQELIDTLSSHDGPEFVLYEKFHIILDEHGILRLKNYLPYSPYAEDITSPILFHPKSHLLRLTVLHVHTTSYHAGTKFTLAAFRRSYFVPKCQRIVTSILRKHCQKCKKEEPKPFFQPTHSAIPDFRLLPFNSPFTYVGIDLIGPFKVFKEYLPKRKGQLATPTSPYYNTWILIFTCLSTRAVHLSVVESLTSTELWTVFSEFFSDRTTPKLILSDNARQFHLIASYIPHFWTAFISEPFIEKDMKEKGIQWKFIPAKAPWYGGVYERLVGLVKQALYRTLSHHPTPKMVFRSTLKGIQTMINERPLCPAVDEAEQLVLTPAHFLHAKLGCYIDNMELPEKGVSGSSTTLLKFWRQDERYQEQIWSMWKHLYLTYLRDKAPQGIANKRCTNKTWPREGEIVHVLDFKARKGVYKLAKISAVTPSPDGKVRHADIEFFDGRPSSRPIKFLAPLELCVPAAQELKTHLQKSISS